MAARGVYTLNRIARPMRSNLCEPVPVELELPLPKEAQFMLYNINLGGAGVALPIQYDPALSKEENIKRNSIKIKAKIEQKIIITIPESDLFKRDLILGAEIRFIATAQKMHDVLCLYYFGLSFNRLSDRNFRTIENAMMRL